MVLFNTTERRGGQAPQTDPPRGSRSITVAHQGIRREGGGNRPGYAEKLSRQGLEVKAKNWIERVGSMCYELPGTFEK
jgi:hypothetical protein